MTHQKRLSVVIGGLGGVAAAVLPFLVNWGAVTEVAPDPAKQVHDLGIELMSRSMIIFETAGVTILVAMIVATMLATPQRQGQKSGQTQRSGLINHSEKGAARPFSENEPEETSHTGHAGHEVKQIEHQEPAQ